MKQEKAPYVNGPVFVTGVLRLNRDAGGDPGRQQFVYTLEDAAAEPFKK